MESLNSPSEKASKSSLQLWCLPLNNGNLIDNLSGKDSRSVDTNEDSTFDEDSVAYDTDHDKIYQILNINQPDDATNDNANENKVFDSDKDSNDATASTEAAERLHSDPLSSSSPRIFIHSVISSSIPVALIFVTAIL